MAQLVTGEAVVLELRLARLASRLLALALDVVVQVAALTVGLLVVAGAASTVDEALAAALSLVLVVLVILGYPVGLETLTRGRTLGKMALGLRVVRDDGGPIRFRQALMRGLVGVVELWATSGIIALVASLVSPQGKRLGDLLAGTAVVRERMPAAVVAPVAMPAGLAGWAADLQLSRLPDPLALATRQYLARLPQLAPEVRERMGRELADAVAAAVFPPPPPGVPSVDYLSAVLAERSRREYARLSPAAGPPAYRPGPEVTVATPAPPTPAPPAPAPPAAEPPAPAGPFAPPG